MIIKQKGLCGIFIVFRKGKNVITLRQKTLRHNFILRALQIFDKRLSNTNVIFKTKSFSIGLNYNLSNNNPQQCCLDFIFIIV
jgi:hypothetical protein